MKKRISTACVASLAALLAMTSAPSGATSLDEALAASYRNNPTLRAERANLRATDEQVPQALSEWLPTITANAATGRVHQITGITGANATAANSFDIRPKTYGLQLNQSIFSGFRTLSATSRAKSNVRTGRAILQSSEQAVLLDAVTVYMDVLRDQAVHELNQNNVQVLRRQLEATQDRFSVGEITRTDVAQSEAALSLAIANRTLAESQLTASRAFYQQVVGEVAQGLSQPAAATELPQSLEESMSLAMELNPFLNAARHAEASAGHAVNLSKGGLLPSIDVQGQLQKSENVSQFVTSVEVSNIFARATIPLYQSGKTYSQIRQAKEQHSRRLVQVIEQQRAVTAEVARTWASHLAIRSSIESRNQQVRANEIALEGVRQEAMVGSRTTLDALEAEQTLLNSRVELVRSNRDQFIADYELLAAVGRLTAAGLGLSVATYDPDAHYDDVHYQFIGWGSDSGEEIESD